MKMRQTFLASTLALSLVYPLLLFRAGYLVGSRDKQRSLYPSPTVPTPRNRFGLGRSKRNSSQSNNNYAPSRNLTTPNTIQNSANGGGKPLFILHVGPEKTATTTIQWYASEYQEELEQDNIFFLGHGRNKNLHQLYNLCVDAKLQNTTKCNELWKQFRTRVHFHYRRNHTVFVSEELFSGFGKYDLQKHLWRRLTPFKQQWSVRVLFTYRRFHEWLPSRYYQRYDPNPPFAAIPQERAAFKQQWPGGRNGGKKIATMHNFLSGVLDKLEYNSPLSIMKKWKTNFEDVRVFNMHEHNSNDIHTGFYCNMIPEASVLCNKLKEQQNKDAITQNSSTQKVVHFDMIAVRALEKHFFDRNLSRTDVAKAVEAFATRELNLKTLADFPLVCPTKAQTDRLLKITMSIEQTLVPEFFVSTRGRYDLKLSFEQAVEEKRFCSVNVNKVVNSERWKAFFKTRLAQQ